MRENVTIALAGNPNCGKTSLFNEFTGANQYVGNWPGVTVEKKEGKYKKDKEVIIQDLPGIYSLSPYTPEEIIARDYLLEQTPNVILNVVDSTNLERNLYLTTQLLEVGAPVVIALNMMDLLKKQGRTINTEKLAYGLGIDVIGTSAIKGTGLNEVVKKAIEVGRKETLENQHVNFDDKLETAIQEIQTIIIEKNIPTKQLRWYSIKIFERDERVLGELQLSKNELEEIEEIITITEKIFEDDAESIVINERYEFITRLVQLCVVDKDEFSVSVSDKIDRVVTNRFLALPIFAVIMWAVYYLSIQTVGTMGTDWVNDVLFGEVVPDKLGGFLSSMNVAPWMTHLILDGVVAGVGAVLGFLPQMVVLFLCLAFLEDCGYMARIAFVMDRIFRKFGLSGKSFIPMLIATGCGVPGIMASRTIENEKDRKMTVMVTTFMPCSAKIPIIALIAGAFFPNNSLISPSAYFIGMAAVILSGIILKKTKYFAGDLAPFIMELPAYHFPRLKGVVRQTYDRSKAFVKKAGTIIFVSSILIWFLTNYNFRLQMVAEDKSILAFIGSLFAFLFKPLGFGTWQATVATFNGLVAKENIVGTFGILYGGLSEVSEHGNEVWGALRASYTPMGGYSFLVFNLLCAPCFASIGAIQREMLDWRWTMGAVAYQCGLAYIVSFIVFQLGSYLMEGVAFGMGQILAIVIVLLGIYLLIRKPKKYATELSVVS